MLLTGKGLHVNKKGAGSVGKPELIAVNCKTCKRFLCKAPAGSESMCPSCCTWTMAGGNKKAVQNNVKNNVKTTGQQDQGPAFEQGQLF